MAKPPNKSFNDILTEAVSDIAENGFDDEARLAVWMDRLRKAAERALPSPDLLDDLLRGSLLSLYKRLVENGEISKFHPGVSKFTIANLRPQMKAELDKRIMASASLIKLNRKQAIDKTLSRFAGWTTSIPAGGTSQANKAETKANIKKSFSTLPFEERRVLIDQGHKLTASISEVIANDSGALAMEWRSNWRQPGYNYREDHKERDRQIYVMRASWAADKGFVKAGENPFYDDITKVAEEPFCRCYATWIYNIRDLPPECVTAKGRAALADARAKIKAS